MHRSKCAGADTLGWQLIRLHHVLPLFAPAELCGLADFLERCILFLVRPDALLALGAFGLGAPKSSVSAAVLQLRVPLAPGSLLERTVASGAVFQGRVEDPDLDRLYAAIRAPASPDIMLMPLRTDDRTVALIYGDFGERPATTLEVDALEILAVQASLALEAALLRRRLAEGSPRDHGIPPDDDGAAAVADDADDADGRLH